MLFFCWKPTFSVVFIENRMENSANQYDLVFIHWRKYLAHICSPDRFSYFDWMAIAHQQSIRWTSSNPIQSLRKVHACFSFRFVFFFTMTMNIFFFQLMHYSFQYQFLSINFQIGFCFENLVCSFSTSLKPHLLANIKFKTQIQQSICVRW